MTNDMILKYFSKLIEIDVNLFKIKVLKLNLFWLLLGESMPIKIVFNKLAGQSLANFATFNAKKDSDSSYHILRLCK